MRNQGQFTLGIVIVVVGVVLLLANLLHIDLGVICWPMAFILLGLFFILRPRMIEPGTAVTQKFLGEVKRSGSWAVNDEEFWYFIADADFDMTSADIPFGETRIRALGFVSDIDLRVPKDVGVLVSSTAFVSEVDMLGDKEESFLGPIHLETPNYKLAERKIRLETTSFVSDIKVRWS
ncbi:MAG: cell wall-active antibiotics response protein [Ardenticatenaceae bacterium]|nr:cell wall-active antibiotics response protein [Ardenticatenaceae bacterium]MCB8987750.1 cell wall-active antibiotics response protein [Ardenticatenaceae bacterium]